MTIVELLYIISITITCGFNLYSVLMAFYLEHWYLLVMAAALDAFWLVLILTQF